MGFYFSEVPVLVNFIAPKENREWGILENLQLVIIFCIFLLSIYGSFKKARLLQKLGFCFVAFFAIFIFLEEMSYGVHLSQLLGGSEETYLSKYIPNNGIHSQGNNALLFKRTVKIIMALIFVIAPFFKSKIKNPYIRYVIPLPQILILAFLTLLVEYVPRLIVAFELRKDGGLGRNIAEFSEVMVYYIFLIYLIQLIFVNQLQIEKKPSIS